MKRYLPLLIIIILMALAYISGVTETLTFENLKAHRQQLQQWVAEYPIGAPLAFIIIYAVSTALSIPGGLFLSLFGGFLYPQPYSTIYVVIGATAGATMVFLAAKTALGDILKKQAGSLINKMQKGFQDNAVSYLLFLRLVPIFPFWLVNIAPAFFGVTLSTYLWTTFLGIIPGSFVFTQAGTGLGAILDSGEEFSLHALFNNDIKIALIALGIFALLPAVIKKLRGHKQ